MNAHTITAEQIARYGEHLREEERAPGTVENYLRNVDRFVFWLAGTCRDQREGSRMEGASGCPAATLRPL